MIITQKQTTEPSTTPATAAKTLEAMMSKAGSADDERFDPGYSLETTVESADFSSLSPAAQKYISETNDPAVSQGLIDGVMVTFVDGFQDHYYDEDQTLSASGYVFAAFDPSGTKILSGSAGSWNYAFDKQT